MSVTEVEEKPISETEEFQDFLEFINENPLDDDVVEAIMEAREYDRLHPQHRDW